ncbi:flagellar filament capping protein FliD [Curvibacter sp. CHRR-16]|uniref:flagellar filament capping protein FliD n=1 Tax=Curvibacter sp. CHRR-16 TaxID=2835872 RepID=UPI001BDA5BC8|nr:flagellar filament capping protein FliD [Curvibacter sp. CHRR-16]MBT0569528.1 flagellar filament capping protein FliD [Curvibacter sp. CHRR-16]
MATISSVGVGSGLDAEGIITKLVTVEKAPLQGMQKKAESIKTQISDFGQIKSQFSALADAANAMNSPEGWGARKGTSSNESVATVTVKPNAAPTSFNLEVLSLAKQQSVASPAIDSGQPVGEGTLTVRLGSWNQGQQGYSFKPAPSGKDIDIKVTASDTLSAVASKINAANAGVVATVLRDGDKERLLMRSKDMGAEAGFRIQADIPDEKLDPAGADLSRLVFDPAYGAVGMAGSDAGDIQLASDTKALINGVEVSSKNNNLDDNIPGVSIALLTPSKAEDAASGSVTITVSEDVTVAVKNVQNFITAYNTLSQTLTEVTKYDPESKQAGTFQGDSGVVGMLNLLRTIAGSSSEGGQYHTLSEVGVERQLDGSLSMNTAKFGQAANNGQELKKLFTADNKNPQTNGFALKFRDFARGAIAADGVVSSKSKALDKDMEHNQDDQKRLNDRVAMTEARLRKQYTQLDKKMGSLNALNAYVSQQVTNWNKSKD